MNALITAGFIELLGQLTKVGDVTREQFLERFAAMKQRGCYYVTIIEDVALGRIIGAATLVVEHKFIHGCGLRGHLEDVVVNDTYRGRQLGKLIVTTINLLAREVGCYKITLECKASLVKMYSSFGYVREENGSHNSMNLRFEDQAFLRNKI
ncbi:hypothetical protein B566_EDAN002479 [Ephemera danica]|nr:hypothetical protein B566_EDAN002479 [Ephemera danica]